MTIEGRKQQRSGWVYVLQGIGTDYYKIGKTSNPENRLRTFGVKLPLDVRYAVLIRTQDRHVMEKRLHTDYEHKRVDGEWFALDDNDLEDICARYNGRMQDVYEEIRTYKRPHVTIITLKDATGWRYIIADNQWQRSMQPSEQAYLNSMSAFANGMIDAQKQQQDYIILDEDNT